MAFEALMLVKRPTCFLDIAAGEKWRWCGLAGSLATQLTGYPVVPSQHLRFVLVHAKVFRRSVLLFDCVGVVFSKASSLSDKVQS